MLSLKLLNVSKDSFKKCDLKVRLIGFDCWGELLVISCKYDFLAFENWDPAADLQGLGALINYYDIERDIRSDFREKFFTASSISGENYI
jgi:hypothetical protein